MTAHDNISVPNESWPNWTWYAIEFALVFVASMVIAWQISDIILYNVAASFCKACLNLQSFRVFFY